MSLFKQFEGSNSSHFNNAMHAAFHTEQLNVLQKVDEETLETMNVMAEEVEGYAMTVDKLTGRSMEARASTDTAETKALDSERGRLVSIMFYLVVSGLSSSVAKEAEAAQTLEVILRAYKGIQGKPMDQETQMIRGLLVDLKESKAAEAVTTLRLNETMTQLEAINNKFVEVKNKRVKNRHTKKMQANTKELRLLADEQLEEIKENLRAAGIMMKRKPESKVLLNMISDLIDDMNAVTCNFKMVYNQSTAQKGANRKSDKENTGDGGDDSGGLEFQPVEE